jgi:hypothetical protein
MPCISPNDTMKFKTKCPDCHHSVEVDVPDASVVSAGASLRGRKGKGSRKVLSDAERAARSQRMSAMLKARWAKK